jgi:hypothetical protein
MKRILSAGSAALLLTSVPAFATESPDLTGLSWLVGDWRGAGEGEPGKSTSERHVERVLDGKFVRVNGSVYPKQEKNPNGETHAEMDMWGFDRARKLLTLRQFDTLGFVSTYVFDVTSSTDTRWVLIAETLENVPQGWRARYVYTLKSPLEYEEALELDVDGAGFKPYVTNRFTKVTKTS